MWNFLCEQKVPRRRQAAPARAKEKLRRKAKKKGPCGGNHNPSPKATRRTLTSSTQKHTNVKNVLPEAPLNLQTISRASALAVLGLVLPALFHSLGLGKVFLPMYLPVLVGAFVLPWRWAVALGVLTPLLSALLTGMPPWFPPVALWMALELGLMALVAHMLGRRLKVPWALAPSLLLGRCTYAGLVFVTAQFLELPPGVLSLASWLSAWPGLVLAMLVVPAGVAALRRQDVSLQPSRERP